jgi:hypothetical protein
VPGEERWVVTTSGNRALGDVQKDLEKRGFVVEEVLDAIGLFIGNAKADVIADVRTVAGVADVSREPPPISIGPPDESVS